ncbi:MAG: hypothetical protein U1F49_20545 [Rubrivivax sp.]
MGSVLALTNSIGFAISALSIGLCARAVAASSLAQVLPHGSPSDRRSGCWRCGRCSSRSARRRSGRRPAARAGARSPPAARGAQAPTRWRTWPTSRTGLRDAAVARPGPFLRQAHRFLDRFRLHQVEAREHFLRLRERTVEHLRAFAADAHRARRGRRLELLVAEQRAALLQLVGMLQAVAHVRVELLLRKLAEQRGIGVDEEQELHGGWARRCGRSWPVVSLRGQPWPLVSILRPPARRAGEVG